MDIHQYIINLQAIIKRFFNMLGFDIKRHRKRPHRSKSTFRKKAPVNFDNEKGSVNVLRFEWATATEAMELIDRDCYSHWEIDANNYGMPLNFVESHKWSLKGYGYCLISETVRNLVSSLTAGQKLRILEIGGGGSGLCKALTEQFPIEAYLIDDFGIESNDLPTKNWYPNGKELRASLAKKNWPVKYIFGRLGDENLNDLEQGSFDLIFSISTLEHIHHQHLSSVFDHMFKLLKPTGKLLHTIDIASDLFSSWQLFLAEYLKHYGVQHSQFDSNNLDELDDYHAPLLESVEVQFKHGRREYNRYGSLVLEINKNQL